ncbi:hypothetical protein [Bradyrhizobium elkanii]|uniref:hypothetical protein n=1 Tax=Bradyrhizobium elkanii TaxID=29448 RepID=UPI003511F341
MQPNNFRAQAVGLLDALKGLDSSIIYSLTALAEAGDDAKAIYVQGRGNAFIDGLQTLGDRERGSVISTAWKLNHEAIQRGTMVDAAALIVACAALDQPVKDSLASLIEGGDEANEVLGKLKSNAALNAIEEFFERDGVYRDIAFAAFDLIEATTSRRDTA